MSVSIKKVEVWAADLLNRPGMLARVLEALRNAEAELEFIIARRVTENTSRLFVAPLKGKKQLQAASDVGLVPAVGMHALRVLGSSRPGLAADLARCVASAGINLRGVSAAVIGKKTAVYLAFAKEEEMLTAGRAIKKLLKGGGKK